MEDGKVERFGLTSAAGDNRTAPRAPWSSYAMPLFVLLCVALVSVFLFSPITVTLDGYSHLYGARMLGDMLRGDPEAHRYFSYNSAFTPNWFASILLLTLSSLLPNEVALKLLILLVGGALLASLYSCVDVRAYSWHQRSLVLIILLPLAVNGYLTLGFYGFLLSASMCLWVLGVILRHGADMPLRFQGLCACLLLVAYFSNPLPVLLSSLFPLTNLIAKRIAAHRDRLHLRPALFRPLLCLWPWIPPASLILWFSFRLSNSAGPRGYSAMGVLAHRSFALAKDALPFISPAPGGAAIFIALLSFLLLGLGFRYKRDYVRDTTLMTVLICSMFGYLFVPNVVGDASMMANRVLLHAAFFLVLIALPRVAPDAKALTACALVATLSILGFAGEYFSVSRTLSPPMLELQRAMDRAPKHSRILVLAYRMTPSCKGLPLLERSYPESHMAMSAAIRDQLFVLNDYQAYTSHFPLRLLDRQAFIGAVTQWGMTSHQAHLAWHKPLTSDNGVEFVVSWGIPSGPSFCEDPVAAPSEDSLRIKYDLIFSGEGDSRVQLWRRRV
jgi:hypothetical protein